MGKIVVVTGASAGVGRATAREFAQAGCDVAIIARNAARLADVEAELRGLGVRALAVPCDVADAEGIKAAADRIERELGPIDVWVNNAMATVFAPVREVTAAEFRRGTEVTYLGQVHGTQAALSCMLPRDRGTIVNVGSALSYRAVPLQSVYCGAKYAVRGFTDALRSELIHDGSRVRLTMVHLPAINTPQFDWALNKMGRRAQPVPPIYAPDVPARAIVFAAFHRRREIWVGWPTVKAIIANKLAPGLIDHYLARYGYSSQLGKEHTPSDAPANLFVSVDGPYGENGRFGARARQSSDEMFTDRHRDVVLAGVAAAAVAGVAILFRRRRAALTRAADRA